MNPHIIEDMHHIPETIAYLPTVMMAIGAYISSRLSISRPAVSAGRTRQAAALALPVPAQQVVFRRDLRSHLRPGGQWLGGCPGKGGDGYGIDGFSPDGVSARVRAMCTRGSVPAPDRLSVSLRLRDGDRGSGFVTWMTFGGAGKWCNLAAVLSIVTFLPLVGAVTGALPSRQRRGGETHGALDGDVRHPDDVGRSLILVWRVRSGPAGFQFVEERDGSPRLPLQHGRGRHLAAIRDPDHRPVAVLHHCELEIRHLARARNT